ncbi:hypothetical protein JCM6882_007806 [Rhodosporidiobolus microsporus]
MYAWQAQPVSSGPAHIQSALSYSSHVPSTALPLPPQPPSNPLPPPPLASDVYGARIKLTLDKVKIELGAVKSALDEVKRLSEGVAGLKEEVRLMREEREEKDSALEKRILASVSDLLSSHLSPLSASLDKSTSTILDSITHHAKRVEVRLDSVEEAVEAQGEKVKRVEGVEQVKELAREAIADGEEREKAVMEKVEGLAAAFEAQAGTIQGWEETLGGLEERVKALEETLIEIPPTASDPPNPFSSKTSSAAPRPPPSHPHLNGSTITSSTTPSAPSSTDAVAGNSPPRPHRPRRILLPAQLSASLPSFPSAVSNTLPGSASEAGRTVSAPQPATNDALSSSTTSASASTTGLSPARPKRRLLDYNGGVERADQDEDQTGRDGAASAGSAGIAPSPGAKIPSPSASDPVASSPWKRRRVIAQEETPSGTPEGGEESEGVEEVEGEKGTLEAESGLGSLSEYAEEEEDEEKEPETQ